MQLVWRPLVDKIKVSAKPAGVWTRVIEFVGPSRKLRIEATGTWSWQAPAAGAPAPATGPTPAGDVAQASPGSKRECGPDGDQDVLPPASALTQDALAGALIGKIGGSSATIKNTDAFVVGSFCIVDVSEATKGPLFLTINDDPNGMTDNSGELTVSVWESL